MCNAYLRGRHPTRTPDFGFSESLSHQGAQTPLDLSIEVTDSEIDSNDPARIEFIFQNKSEGWISVGTAPPPPFGVLRVQDVSDGMSLVLWTGRYKKVEGITAENKWAKDVANDVGTSLILDPGDTQTLGYTLHTATRNLTAGIYRTLLVDEQIRVREQQDGEGEEDYTTYGNPKFRLTLEVSQQ